ncbi:hypothetical protein [Leptospira borgpetersenii]|uniref:Uncharacterized protein n=3 Tax=Leptospira borgpetersenii TaxID=174 RepID=Q04NK5_LEPBJ|nr:hypothetical protein [Leptospira borgpetersenii]EMO62727.1 hypothetical protein LEP1GSC133_3522 [Leptospira borgpetersenii serovar Pomona str. 200901868]ABJ77515.1 Hypothetical protein LBJ_4122 [Leptospira borgpetersenii serovar Hardjo-bovis str. JB197]ABJ80457.1 Hypothetical protein LBL_4138 [Leptospira borgpetersenii serovar Hardjo-bovis str. L550]AMX59905.1 hypothetical protein LBK6_16800 [Leptospira borgpetersenii serovar Hardjo]AMX63134.1 hypothetical protein LBK9_16735 [Leptospira bor
MLEYSSVENKKNTFGQRPIFLQRIVLRLVSILVVAVLLQNCTKSEVVSAGDSQSQIYAAANYLSNKCGNPIPTPMPFTVQGVKQRNLDICTIAITRSECPFVSYPLACVLIYVDNPIGDIPWYINFQEVFVKIKL